MSSLRDFLFTVDATRGADFVDKVIPLMAAQDITEPSHLQDSRPGDWRFSQAVALVCARLLQFFKC